jgi:hypothetical protein
LSGADCDEAALKINGTPLDACDFGGAQTGESAKNDEGDNFCRRR